MYEMHGLRMTMQKLLFNIKIDNIYNLLFYAFQQE